MFSTVDFSTYGTPRPLVHVLMDRGGWTVKRCPDLAQDLFWKCVERFPVYGSLGKELDYQAHADQVQSILAKEVSLTWDECRDYGNPVVVLILVKIILPIVIELLIKWWLHHAPNSDPIQKWASSSQ